MTLDQLSAAATQGEAMSYAKSIVEAVEQGCNYEDKCLAVRDWLLRYHTGQLIAVADDAIERVARALRVKCAEIDHRPDVNSADPMWFAHEYALAAIAAMKDTQPALATKGDA